MTHLNSFSFSFLSTHRKAVVAAVGFALAVASLVWGPDDSRVVALLGLATTLGVVHAPNRSA